MSINFAGVQGLTIPEGKVMKITDASGRVLWSAETEFTGSCYLRPSADISVEHSLYPAANEGAHLLLSEEVSDNNSTYIYITLSRNSTTTKTTSVFTLNSNISPKRATITSAKLYASMKTGTDLTGSVYFILNIAGNELTYAQNFVNVVLNSMHYTLISLDASDAMSIINNYVATNGKLPPMNITVTTQLSGSGTSSKTVDFCISQVYLELVGEYIV